ncbi:DUF4367 domain-containing protein [Paenibacillus sp. PL2-23]|uniref:DUF4367 domain-containing protein n=1 Tax=Paenibacillus sp. PL2-23 TaxID=2100729 RepID=UPI0030FBB1F0
MNKEEFDERFDRAFQEKVKDHEFVPDASESWLRVKKRIDRRYRIRRQLRTLPYVAASFLLGAYIFGTPVATEAFKPVFQAYQVVIEGVQQMVFRSAPQQTDFVSQNLPKTLPPPGYVDETSQQGTSITVTKPSEIHDLAFPAPSIRYVPEAFSLHNIQLSQVVPGEGKYTHIHYGYARSDGMVLHVVVMKLPQGAAYSSGGGSEDIIMKPITIHGFEAFLYLEKDGWSMLEYMRDDMLVKISGPIDEDTIVRMAEELRIYE